MGEQLLERDAELAVLEDVLTAAEAGEGSVVLLHGEAGIGKTSVVRALVARASGRARVLVGGCEDMMTQRPLGPLRDAVGGHRGPLHDALETGDRDAVLVAARAELATGLRPTVLVVEDAQWADEATLDVLRHLGRRVEELTGVLVLTYREGEGGWGHPLHGLLGGLTGPRVHRVPLRPLSLAAVARLDRTAIGAPALHRLTGGNPFFLTEVLAAAGSEVPPTVRDAVLARVQRLPPETRRALEQLSVVPAQVALPLARALVPDLGVLGEAERRGVLVVRPDAVAFRHELARRAVAESLPVSVRIPRHAAVLAALLDAPTPDGIRIVHHAAHAGEDEVVVAHAPSAARRADAAGAHRQARWLYEAVLAREHLLDPAVSAAVHEEYAWVLFNLNLAGDAIAAAEAAVRRWGEQDEPLALGQALAGLALLQWAGLRVGAARESARRAAELLAGRGDDDRHVTALIRLGMTLVNVDRETDGLERLDAALAMARRLGADHLVPRCQLYRGRAHAQLGEPSGIDEIRDAVARARGAADHPTVLLGQLNAVMVLWHLGRFDEVERHLAEAAAYARDKEVPVASVGLEVYRQRCAALRGDIAGAADTLRALHGGANYEAAERLVLPALAQVLVRQGADDAAAVLDAAWGTARAADSVLALVPAGLARLEHAWLTGRDDPGLADVVAVLVARTAPPGWSRQRAELARLRRRLDHRVAAEPGTGEELAAGVRGDWRAAADAWERLGAPYERALELAESGEEEPTREALAVLDGLGARPAAALVRGRLRLLGVPVPRGPHHATRAHPAGLTGRQAEILRLLAAGLANAEIAERLTLSVRTVDHHVSAVLDKLGVASRHAAVAAAAELGVLEPTTGARSARSGPAVTG